MNSCVTCRLKSFRSLVEGPNLRRRTSLTPLVCGSAVPCITDNDVNDGDLDLDGGVASGFDVLPPMVVEKAEVDQEGVSRRVAASAARKKESDRMVYVVFRCPMCQKIFCGKKKLCFVS